MRVALAALSLALLTAGCDPIGEVRFVVVNTAGARVAAARVAITCPGHPAPTHEQSDADGLVVYQSIPDIDPACTFTIEKPGFVTKSIPRAGAGYHQGIDDEAPLVTIVLDPDPTATPAPATGAATQAPPAAPSAAPGAPGTAASP